jgi:MFS family permease
MNCPKSLQLACLYSLLLSAVGTLLTGLPSPFWILCVWSAVRSMGSSVLWINSSLLLQKFSHAEMLGRVSAMEYALALFAEALSAVLAGVLQDNLSWTAEEVSIGLGAFGVVLSLAWGVYHFRGGGAASAGGSGPDENGQMEAPEERNEATSEQTCLMESGNEYDM